MLPESISIRTLWGVLRKVPGYFLRRHFPPERLADLIYFDLQPRHDSAVVNLGPAAFFQLRLQIINLSPVDVELDRATLCFWCGGATFDINYQERQTIQPSGIASIQVRGLIPDGHANQISVHGNSNSSALSGSVEFNCKVHPFKKRLFHLDGINAKFYNAPARSNA